MVAQDMSVRSLASVASVASVVALSWNGVMASPSRRSLLFSDGPVMLDFSGERVIASLAGVESRTNIKTASSLSIDLPVVSRTLTTKIGERGVSRLRQFWGIPQGWDGGSGNELNSRSLDVLNQLAEQLPNTSKSPLVFMSRRGNVILQWSTQSGDVSELEFGPAEISYILAPDYEEGEIPISQLRDLTPRIEQAESV